MKENKDGGLNYKNPRHYDFIEALDLLHRADDYLQI